MFPCALSIYSFHYYSQLHLFCVERKLDKYGRKLQSRQALSGFYIWRLIKKLHCKLRNF